MNSGWGMRLIIRFIGLIIALIAVSIIPLPITYKVWLLLSGGILVMIS